MDNSRPGTYTITAWCCFSIHPENIKKPLGIMMFSGGIEKQQRAVMDELKLERIRSFL